MPSDDEQHTTVVANLSQLSCLATPARVINFQFYFTKDFLAKTLYRGFVPGPTGGLPSPQPVCVVQKVR